MPQILAINHNQFRKMLDLLVHASQCRSQLCQYPNCRKVKGLFRHGGIECKVHASGGCVLCKKMWDLLQLHAGACKESECSVPRCRDLKEHMRRLQQQSDSIVGEGHLSLLRVVLENLQKMLDLLVHTSQCCSPHCQYPNCRNVKGLFHHAIQCNVRVSGGCVLCKKMWYLLQLHARACKESECSVPRCRDLKEHMRGWP